MKFKASSRVRSWWELLDDLTGFTDLLRTEKVLPLLLYKIVFLSLLQEKGLFYDERGEILTLSRVLKSLSLQDVAFCSDILFTGSKRDVTRDTLAKAGLRAPDITIKILNSLKAFDSFFMYQKSSEMQLLIKNNLSNEIIGNLFLLLEQKHRDTITDPEILSFLFGYLLGDKTDRDHRSEKGAFFTPRVVAQVMARKSIEELVFSKSRAMFKGHWTTLDDLLEETNPKQQKRIFEEIIKPLTVLDPASGSGELLIASGEVLFDLHLKMTRCLDEKTTAFEMVKHVVNENLFGVDLLPSAVQACYHRLFLFLADNSSSLHELAPHDFPDNSTIKVGNSLIGTGFDAYSKEKSRKASQEPLDVRRELYLERLRDQLNLVITVDVLERMSPLHWSSEFPAMKRNGGFDIIISNPPWGSRARGVKMTTLEKKLLKKLYPAWGNNIYGAFTCRFLVNDDFLKPGGRGCFILPDTLLTIRTLSDLREQLLERTIQEIILLGDGVFVDAPAMGSIIVRTVNAAPGEGHQVIIVKKSDETTDSDLLSSRDSIIYKVEQEIWKLLNANRYIHGVSPSILKFFTKNSEIPTLYPVLGVVRQGLATGNNARFINSLTSIRQEMIGTNALDFRPGGKKWARIALGRFLRPYKLDIVKVVLWENDGEEIRQQRHPTTGRLKARVQNERYYFKGGGISFKGLGKGNFCAAILPKGCIFSHTTHTIFLHNPESNTKEFLLGYLNGLIGRFFVDRCINTGKHVEVNDVAELPVIIPDEKRLTIISRLVDDAIKASSNESAKDLEIIQKEIDQLIMESFGLLSGDFEECYEVSLGTMFSMSCVRW
ncbi:MAG: Eco57I restriction-modification methylase domain-containing protein [Candidatus Hodarchaeales archaeon]